MQHKTTVMEVVIEPTDLLSTLQQWAMESDFSLYEKNAERTIYSKNILGARGWISVESQDNQARVEAWQSSKDVGPDFVGNFWVGWKMPVPTGFVVGPNGVYKKQVNTLFRQLVNKSSGVPAAQTLETNNKLRSFLNKSSVANGMAIVGVVELLSGFTSLISSATLGSSSIPGLRNSVFQSGLHDTIVGLLFLVSSRLLAKGRLMAI
jgi:hypothetical protein